MNSLVLAPKFDPYILNKAVDPQLKNLCGELDNIFQNVVNPKRLTGAGFNPISIQKSHILTHANLSGWIIKVARDDQYHYRRDQHIYRVRKMARVRKVIEKYQFTSVKAPQKYLYEFKGEWYVIAEKMDLMPGIKIDNVPWETAVPRNQLKALTPQQARELAIICYEAGLPDMGAHNLGYLATGQVCPFDSEPLTRGLKKKWKRYPIPGLKIAVDYFLAKANADRLYAICHDPKAKEEVIKVQREMLIKHVAKLTSLSILPIIASGVLYAAINTMNSSLLAVAGTAGLFSGLNAISSMSLLALSVFSEHITGPLAYEGDLLDKYASIS